MDLIVHNFYLFFTDAHIQAFINLLSVVIIASKIVPTLRFLSLGSQLLILLLGITRHWLDTHPEGKKIKMAVLTPMLPNPEHPSLSCLSSGRLP